MEPHLRGTDWRRGGRGEPLRRAFEDDDPAARGRHRRESWRWSTACTHGTYPTFTLNAVLLPLNAWRLRSMLGLIRDIDAATRSDMNVDWLLPYTRPRHFKAGDIVMARGDYATAAFDVVSGEVEIVEIGETFGKGTLLGEIGLFTPTAAAP